MIKVADWVTTPSGGMGTVKRIAKNGSWADVNWGQWSKRMPVTALTILTTISLGEGWTVTDMSRETELREDESK